MFKDKKTIVALLTMVLPIVGMKLSNDKLIGFFTLNIGISVGFAIILFMTWTRYRKNMTYFGMKEGSLFEFSGLIAKKKVIQESIALVGISLILWFTTYYEFFSR